MSENHRELSDVSSRGESPLLTGALGDATFMLRAMADSAQDRVWLFDREGRVCFLNQAAAGISSTYTLGLSIAELPPPVGGEAGRAALEAALRTGQPTSFAESARLSGELR